MSYVSESSRPYRAPGLRSNRTGDEQRCRECRQKYSCISPERPICPRCESKPSKAVAR